MNNLSAADAYRTRSAERAVTERVELPSGAVFVLRRPPLKVWILSGQLPMSVAAAMERNVRSEQEAARALAELPAEDQDAMFRFLRRLVCFACVEPRVAEEPQNGELSISELDEDDLRFLISWTRSGGETADAANFRGQRSESAVGRAHGQKLRKAAK